jgi:hypothetical protein
MSAASAHLFAARYAATMAGVLAAGGATVVLLTAESPGPARSWTVALLATTTVLMWAAALTAPRGRPARALGSAGLAVVAGLLLVALREGSGTALFEAAAVGCAGLFLGQLRAAAR